MPTNRESDAVRIKREAQERIDRETESMAPAERDAYINRRADEFAERLGIKQVSRPIGRGPNIGAEDARQAG
jgi:hypothetical protein